MFAESSDDEQIIERVAALDIGKAEIVCCIRLPAADGGRRVQEVSTYSTMVTSLCELANRLVGLGVQAGGDGGDQRLLAAAVLPVRGPRPGSIRCNWCDTR